MLYICDTFDGRQMMRSRLFSHWVSMYASEVQFFTMASTLKDENGVDNYAAILLRTDNPKLSEIVDEFTQTIEALSK